VRDERGFSLRFVFGKFLAKMLEYMPMSILNSIFPSGSDRKVKSYHKTVEAINALEPAMAALDMAGLLAKSQDLRAAVQAKSAELKAERMEKVKGYAADDIAVIEAKASGFTKAEIRKILDPYLPEAFAIVREAAKRALNQRHYDVQLIGGLVLNDGMIAEMKTGEGKTQMATLPVYLNALMGKGVHVVTVNDYLSRRDAVWMGQIYHILGISVAVVNSEESFIYDPSHIIPATELASEPSDAAAADERKAEAQALEKERETGAFKVQYEFLRPVTRREAYAADVTYGTNSEFGFDYLRDNLERDPAGLRQRDFHYAIVDEVDSILIDEARTPLIISAAVADSGELYQKFAQIANKLEENTHYTTNEKYRSIAITDAGIDAAEAALGMENIYSEGGVKYVHHLENAIRAKAVYKAEVDYIVKDGEIMIVDPATGRVKHGHRWSEGLHQAIEAKEGVKIQQESRTQASITFQNYFRLYPKLAGMTGTGQTSSEEFVKVYDLDVISVPTHKPIARLDKKDLIFKTEVGKFSAVVSRIKELHQKGQPVLVGTVSIEKSQELGALLKRAGVPYALLNAKPEFAEREGETIAQAGKRGSVTIATNMAGRGVDIKLGGVPSTPELTQEIRDLGGLFVLGTERHEARRIDNQLRGRSGRQGDPGETQFYVSLEDYLMRNFSGNDFVKNLMTRMKIPDDMPIESGMVGRALETAQTKIEGWYFDSRKHVFEFDNVLNQQRKRVYEDRRAILLGTEPGNEQNLEDAYARLLNFAKNLQRDESATEREGDGESGGNNNDSSEAADKPAPIPEDERLEAKRKEIEATAGNNVAFLQIFRTIMLQSIDTFWIEHLETMDHLRGSVNLRAYGQRDPLVEYKKSGHQLYRDMEFAIQAQAVQVLGSITLDVGSQMKVGSTGPVVAARDTSADLDQALNLGRTNSIMGGNTLGGGFGSGNANNGNQQSMARPVISRGEREGKVGRNDPCPCGSGKKYKKCHGANA
jgi:preprotein translocase subunit SecA